jgi:hypothetical protein
MPRGKSTCKVLKEVRRKIADANGIPLEERECTHTGDCAGTCPYCESEVRYLERELSKRRSLGKAVAVAGIALSAVTIAGQANAQPVSTPDDNQTRQCDTVPPLQGIVEVVMMDTAKTDNDLDARIDTVSIEFTPPEFMWQGTVSATVKVTRNLWRFPSEYGTLKSYLHKELKKNPELRVWLKEKAKQERLKKKDPEARIIAKENKKNSLLKLKENSFLLRINQEGEVVGAHLRYELNSDEDYRMNLAFYRIIDNMPRWTLNPKKQKPDEMVGQEYSRRILR